MARDPSVLVHALALCESDEVGPRTRVWAFAHVLDGARIGADCKVGGHAFVEGGVVAGVGGGNPAPPDRLGLPLRTAPAFGAGLRRLRPRLPAGSRYPRGTEFGNRSRRVGNGHGHPAPVDAGAAGRLAPARVAAAAAALAG